MKYILIAAALAATAGYAHSRPQYDARLEAAAARIVADKMGALRGTFSVGQRPQMVRAMVRADR